jgi:hypothetical protein
MRQRVRIPPIRIAPEPTNGTARPLAVIGAPYGHVKIRLASLVRFQQDDRSLLTQLRSHLPGSRMDAIRIPLPESRELTLPAETDAVPIRQPGTTPRDLLKQRSDPLH